MTAAATPSVDRASECRRCIHWKRKAAEIGQCWNMARVECASKGYAVQFEDDTCDQFSAKVIRVREVQA